MLVDFLIGGIVAYTFIILVKGLDKVTTETPEQKRERERKEALKQVMTDIDPVTGDWTRRGTRERYNKDGIFIGIVDKRGGE